MSAVAKMLPINLAFKPDTPRKVLAEVRHHYHVYLVDDERVEYKTTELHREIKAGMTPGEHLRILREETGRTLKVVGDAIGCTPQRINEYESGRRAISKAAARKLAEVFGVSAAMFI